MLDWIRALPTRTATPSGNSVEDEIIARAKTDRAAFEPLYVQYLEPVYRYCYRRLGSQESAEDATSQVFIKALAALPGYREGSFKAWLFAIAHNVVIDIVRQQRPGQSIEDAYDLKDDAQSPEEFALALDQHRSLTKIISRLPEDQKSVVELRLAGLSGAEIARALKRSEGSIKMLQFRAMARLRELLDVETIAERGQEEARLG